MTEGVGLAPYPFVVCLCRYRSTAIRMKSPCDQAVLRGPLMSLSIGWMVSKERRVVTGLDLLDLPGMWPPFLRKVYTP